MPPHRSPPRIEVVPTATDSPTARPCIAADDIAVTPLSAACGAVVTGVDLARPLAAATVGVLADLVAARGMIVVPGQHLDSDAQLALAATFGTVAVSPLRRLLGSDRGLSTIEDTAERPPAGFDWHTDESWTATPPALGFLHAVVIPPEGGDTIWASGTAAFDRLPGALRRLATELEVVHHMGEEYLRTVVAHHGQRVADALEATHPAIAHPLVRVHERTGRPALWLSPLYQQRIVGLDDVTSRALLDLYGRALEDPHVQVRWRWTEGDVVIWDETCTTHRALVDHFPARRVMRRCTTEGHPPLPAR
jgi:taurine dioxygenase